MWPRSFEQRLAAWNQLRVDCALQPTQQCLETINAWWFDTPWSAYHLHWDDRATWPDPWQLLEDNVFCSVARALGIMYTIVLLERQDLQNTVMLDNGEDNLVLVSQGKYILNWDRDSVVNTCSLKPKQRRILTLQDLEQKIR
jgi:hypothetical protein